MSSSEFDNLKYEQLQAWVFSGKKTDIPETLVKYLEVLELVRSLNDKYKSKKAIIRLLSAPPYNISELRAQKLYAEAINFFYADNDIKKKAWANITAEKLDNLALLAIANDDIECARRCYNDAAKLRMDSDQQQQIPRQLLDRRPVFYTLKAEDVGLPKPDKDKLAVFIDSLPDIPTDIRMALHRDGRTPKSEGSIFELDAEDVNIFSNE
jgi:hypothetical protein